MRLSSAISTHPNCRRGAVWALAHACGTHISPSALVSLRCGGGVLGIGYVSLRRFALRYKEGDHFCQMGLSGEGGFQRRDFRSELLAQISSLRKIDPTKCPLPHLPPRLHSSLANRRARSREARRSLWYRGGRESVDQQCVETGSNRALMGPGNGATSTLRFVRRSRVRSLARSRGRSSLSQQYRCAC